ncbi:chromosome segregation protein SMC [Candidatus Ichthyocystis sparus]|uniref:chromosome segregation protein SMC n=1 Tax=Candidatus Ichthyocystis sparus TaxID=1561004 RepID=UPI000ABA713E|nr:chromosome segregation protein SMC [Candidatus Ichthyocystis sparus]
MYLKSIKMSGFKTFLDPTLIVTTCRLVGIVGPNGCGKSNVIDAVRWVLGESRASALRGQGSQDVIFCGSQSRKAVSRASVELIFDNNSGSFPGRWSGHAEISIKRVITRSGDSVYSMNGQTVRRRDVVDAFLGTGVGAYAIIEQGMVSRLIESKPAEVRLFIEEAAGVSRYRERRRETESRLVASMENLQRVEDIRSELLRTLTVLEGEAKVASEYKCLNDRLDYLNYWVWGYRKIKLESDRNKVQQSLKETESLVANEDTLLSKSELELSEIKAEQVKISLKIDNAREIIFEKGKILTKIESEKKYLQEKKNDLCVHKESIQKKIDSTVERLEEIKGSLLDASKNLEVSQVHYDEILSKHDNINNELQEAERDYNASDSQFRLLENKYLQLTQKLALHETEKSSAQCQIDDWSQRLIESEEMLSSLQVLDNSDLDSIVQKKQQHEHTLSSLSEEIDKKFAQVDNIKLERSEVIRSQHEIQNRTIAVQARCELLEDQQSTDTDDFYLSKWLGDNTVRPIWQFLKIEKGWQKAVEVVLDYRLQAGFFANNDYLLSCLENRPTSRATVFCDTNVDIPVCPNSLINKVEIIDHRFKGALIDWLADVICADNFCELIDKKKDLEHNQILVTPEGDIATATMISFYANSSNGVLVRQLEIDELQSEIAKNNNMLKKYSLDIERHDKCINDSNIDIDNLRNKKDVISKLIYDCELSIIKCEEQIKSYNDRKAQFNRVRDEAKNKMEHWSTVHDNLVQLISDKEDERAVIYAEKVKVGNTANSLRERFEKVKKDYKDVYQEKQKRYLRVMEYKQMEKHLIDLRKEFSLIQEANEREYVHCCEELSACILEQENEDDSEAAIAEKLKAESELAAVEDDNARVQILLSKHEEKIRSCRKRKENNQSMLTKEQLKYERLHIQYSQLMENRKDHWEYDSDEILSWFASCSFDDVSDEINQKKIEIGKLGTVNLGACAKWEEENKRHDFLQNQINDLTEAIKTLRDAISQIDGTSRQRLQETFAKVNENLLQIFPRLFGGGEARFVLLDDDILVSGMDIVARPPGKKNSSIYLLSGGEKALTGLSVILSLFQLNPAPFCLLDEVDAPLDEANTIRLGKLIQDMALETQFIFVTHSKVFMEIAQQLVGVTMQESGISRIVEVGLRDTVNVVDQVEKNQESELIH